MKLANKVAVITGAGSGIGRATAILFAKEGAKVVVANVTAAHGEETLAAIKANGSEAIFVKTDVTKASEAENLTKATIEKFGRIDILFNNAGIFMKETPFEDIAEALWDSVYSVNVKGIFLITKYAVPAMKKAGGGVIINTSSSAAVKPGPHHAPYASSKGAVISLTKALAVELAPYNIRVNCIKPGPTDTPMMTLFSEEARKSIVGGMLGGKMATPEDIALAALYLASDDSSMVTGTSIAVDGGLSM